MGKSMKRIRRKEVVDQIIQDKIAKIYSQSRGIKRLERFRKGKAMCSYDQISAGWQDKGKSVLGLQSFSKFKSKFSFLNFESFVSWNSSIMLQPSFKAVGTGVK